MPERKVLKICPLLAMSPSQKIGEDGYCVEDDCKFWVTYVTKHGARLHECVLLVRLKDGLRLA